MADPTDDLRVEGMPEAETWADLVRPLAAKFDTGFVSNWGVSFNAVGCQNMSALLRMMAQKLDYAIQRGLKDEGQDAPDQDGGGSNSGT